MSQITMTLDDERLAKLDNAAACLGATREEVLNQAIDNFATYLANKNDYGQWLAKKVAKSIKAADAGKLLTSSAVDEYCEDLIANFAPGEEK